MGLLNGVVVVVICLLMRLDSLLVSSGSWDGVVMVCEVYDMRVECCCYSGCCGCVNC